VSPPKAPPDPERQAARRRQQFLEALDDATEELGLEIAQLEDAVRDLRQIVADLVPVVAALRAARPRAPAEPAPSVPASTGEGRLDA
jgi:hypothetical protein